MTRITEPHWGQPVGRVTEKGEVVIDDKFANVLRALVRQMATTVTNVETVTNTGNNPVAGTSGDDLLAAMYGTNGIDIFGSIASGVEIRGSGSSSGSFVPYYIPASDSFSVPLYSQALAHEEIAIDGELFVDGILVEV